MCYYVFVPSPVQHIAYAHDTMQPICAESVVNTNQPTNQPQAAPVT